MNIVRNYENAKRMNNKLKQKSKYTIDFNHIPTLLTMRYYFLSFSDFSFLIRVLKCFFYFDAVLNHN